MERPRRREFERREGLRPARFGAALGLIVLTIFASSFASDAGWIRVTALLCEGAALLFILWTTDVHPRWLLWARIVVVVSVAVAILATAIGSGDTPVISTGLVGAFMAIGAPIAIIRRLADEKVVNLQVLAGALCLYLLIGLFFTFVYGIINAVDTQPLFVQQSGEASSANITYFSFVTLTTTGYGDLTLRGDAPRLLAVTEALFGQLYLVSAVALVVSRLGMERATRRGDSDPADGT
jgi:voltage-gated potassium channel